MMTRSLSVVLTLVVSLSAAAQAPAPSDPSKVIVAVINGETISKAKLDSLYDNLGAQMRSRYEKSGGKVAFLDNYIAKRLVIQEAMKANFDQRADVKAAIESARESVLFDRYVRDVISPQLVSETEMKKYYDEHPADFATPEAVKVRHIIVRLQGREKEEALNGIKNVMAEIRATRPGSAEVALNRFAQAAAKYSEDATRNQGGDLGWVVSGTMDPKFEEVAFRLQPGIMSGIVETPFGYHLVFVEAKQPAGTQSFETAKDDIREFLLSQKVNDVVSAVERTTTELRKTSKVAIYHENVK